MLVIDFLKIFRNIAFDFICHAERILPQGDSLNERVRTLLNAIKNDVKSDDNRSQYIS